MESPSQRPCPSCSAPAQSSQRWCLECGAELPQPRRGGLRPAVGIATTLAVLVGAASAGGYTLLQTGKEPPPPAMTVAAKAPAPTPPPATQEPSTSTYSSTPSYPLPKYSSSSSYGGTTYGGARTTTTPNGGAGDGGSGTGSGTGSGGANTGNQSGGGSTTATRPPPRYVETNIALGAVAVVYAPYTTTDVDLGDASRVADDSTHTAWQTPAVADSTIAPQAGVYIDLAGREKIRRLVVKTPTPGMSIEIYGAVKGPPALITDPGWDHIASRADVKARTSIVMPDTPLRYVLVWVTGLPAGATRASISELALLSLQPE